MRYDFQEHYQTTLYKALHQAGLTRIEYHILGLLTDEYSVASASIAGILNALNHEEVAETIYERAIASLLRKEYVCILTTEHIEALRLKFARENIPALCRIMEDCMNPGDVDLTEEGYLVFRDTVAKVHGHTHIEINESGWIDDEQGKIAIYASMDTWAMDMRIGQAVQNIIGEGQQILTIHKTVSIGQWRPNRFITYPYGNCVLIEYAPPSKEGSQQVRR